MSQRAPLHSAAWRYYLLEEEGRHEVRGAERRVCLAAAAVALLEQKHVGVDGVVEEPPTPHAERRTGQPEAHQVKRRHMSPHGSRRRSPAKVLPENVYCAAPSAGAQAADDDDAAVVAVTPSQLHPVLLVGAQRPPKHPRRRGGRNG